MKKSFESPQESVSRLVGLLRTCREQDLFNELSSRIIEETTLANQPNSHKIARICAGISLPEIDTSDVMRRQVTINGFQRVYVEHGGSGIELTDEDYKECVPYKPLGKIVMGNLEGDPGVAIIPAQTNIFIGKSEGYFVPELHIPEILVGIHTTLRAQ